MESSRKLDLKVNPSRNDVNLAHTTPITPHPMIKLPKLVSVAVQTTAVVFADSTLITKKAITIKS